MNVFVKYGQCLVLMLVCLLWAGIGSLWADISFVPVTWDAGAAGWTSKDSVGTVANGGGNLNMNFAGTGAPQLQSDTMAANNLAGYNGDYTANPFLQVSFDFQGYAASVQSLYFESTAGGGSTWAYDLTVPDSGWHNYTVSLSSPAGWTEVSGAASFASALASVNLIGITVGHLNIGNPLDYNLDDWAFETPVPEPGSLMLLFSALGSFGFVYRFRRRKDRPESIQA